MLTLDTDIIAELMENTNKLMSLNEIMAKYEVGFPFYAYNHKYKANVQIVANINVDDRIVNTCLCKPHAPHITNGSGLEVALSVPRTCCVTGDIEVAGWGFDYKNWSLADKDYTAR